MELTINQALKRAVTAHQNGYLEDADKLYRVILKSQPLHPDANHNLGVLTASLNNNERALLLFKTALHANPDIEQFWFSYIDTLIKVRDVQTAKEYLKKWKSRGTTKGRNIELERRLISISAAKSDKSTPHKSTSLDLEQQQGLATQKQEEKVKKRELINPPKLEIKALTYEYQNGSYEMAEKLARSMISDFPEYQFAYKVFGSLLGQTGRHQEALLINLKAIALSTYDPEAYNNLGNTYKELDRLNEARANYAKAIELNPEFAEAYNNLGATLHQLGRMTEAEKVYGRAIELNPNLPDTHNNLGNTLNELARLSDAEASFRRALELAPNYVHAHRNLANTLKELGRLDEAVFSYERAIALTPDAAEAHSNLGNILRELGKFDEAEVSYMQAIALQPDLAEAYFNLGNTRKEIGRLEKAKADFERAIALKPLFAEAHNNLGTVLQEMGRAVGAKDCYTKAIGLKPNFAEAHFNLGTIFKQLKRYPEAEASYTYAIELKPDYANAIYYLGRLKHVIGEEKSALAMFTKALSLSEHEAEFALAKLCCSMPIVWLPGETDNPLSSFDAELDKFTTWRQSHQAKEKLRENFGAVQPFYLSYHPENMVSRLTLYAQQNFDPHEKDLLVTKTKITKGRIKFGIVTSILRSHSVFHIITSGLLEHLDRKKFSISVYCTDPANSDIAIVRSLELSSNVHIFCINRKKEAKKKLLSDTPDVLLYPEIGMDTTTTWLASQRLAPIQIAAWGHPITTGLASIDYFLSGELIEGPSANDHYSETLVVLPGTGCVTNFEPQKYRQSIWEKTFFPRDEVVFIIPQKPFKFHPNNDEFIVKVGASVPHSVFLLPESVEYPGSVNRILRRLKLAFENENVPFEGRFFTFPLMDHGEFLSLLSIADIYLDLPTFSGYTTAWKAAHCGIPIVTCEGTFLRQRLASGLLKKIGLSENVVNSSDDYANKVSFLVKLRENASSWAEYRNKIRNCADLADNDLSVIKAFEDFLTEVVRAS